MPRTPGVDGGDARDPWCRGLRNILCLIVLQICKPPILPGCHVSIMTSLGITAIATTLLRTLYMLSQGR